MPDQEEEKSRKKKGAVQTLKDNLEKTNTFRNRAMPSMGLPPALLAMHDNLKWIKDLAYPSHIRAIVEMQQQMKSVHEMVASPIADVLSHVDNLMRPYTQLQQSLAGIENSAVIRMAESLKDISSFLPPHFLQTNIPDYTSFIHSVEIGLSATFWDNLDQQDEEDLENVAEIIEGVKAEKSTYSDAIEKLVALAEEILTEQRKVNRDYRQPSVLEKISFIITVLGFLLSAFTVWQSVQEGGATEQISTKTLKAVKQLQETLSEKTKETTANLNLRINPDTTDSGNILLTIPKGEEVIVMQSIKYWCQVQYTHSETGKVMSGWVSKRYLR